MKIINFIEFIFLKINYFENFLSKVFFFRKLYLFYISLKIVKIRPQDGNGKNVTNAMKEL